MPAIHSKPLPTKNAETTNPLRKYKKKLRQAKTEEQRLKAERMIRIHTPKDKEPKKPKKQELTEDQLLNQMIHANEKLRKNPEFITQQQQAELKRQHLEQERKLNHEKIKNEAKERKESEQQNVKKQLEGYEQHKQNEANLNKHLESHKQLLTEFSEKMDIMKTFLEKHKGNKKKATKEFKSQTMKICRFFEYMIREISNKKEISYDEAQQLYYDDIRKTMKQSEPNNDLLQLTASL